VGARRSRYAATMDDKELWGLIDPSTWDRIVVVSPHFDDAALGAAHLLSTYAGSTVITVLAGRPPAYPDPVSDWDAAGGFATGDDVVGVRREEDRAAMASLGAEPVWLDFPDHQYLAPADRPTPADVAPDLAKAVEAAEPTAVFLPMGLANPDHVLTHDAGLMAREALPDGDTAEAGGAGSGAPSWFCYEDAGYKHLPGMLAWRVAKLFRGGLWPTPAVVPVRPDMAAKRTAIWLYASQIGPLERDHLLSERLAANTPEQYWRLEPPPPGWERLSSADALDGR
jgi:LmbE family N-acetylglucosaminyl deacetylase